MGLFIELQVAAIRKKAVSHSASMFRWSCETLMRNCHSAVWAKHQHSRSMHKQMVAWYYWSTMEKGIQEYVRCKHL